MWRPDTDGPRARGTIATIVLLCGLVACGEPTAEEAPSNEGLGSADGGSAEQEPGDEGAGEQDPSDPTEPAHDEPDPTAPDASDEDAGDEGPVELVHEVVDSQATIPQGREFAFADIATDEDGAERAWSRFGLEGDVPEVDLDRSALLFLGMGESGSCPALIDGLRREDLRLEVRHDIEGGPVCTDDYNPRTFVVEVAAEDLPDAGFELRHDGRIFALSAVPVEEPPTTEPTVSQMTAEDPQVELTIEPGAVSVGDAPEVVAHNDGEVYATTETTAFLRWEGQRWLPLPDQPEFDNHPAVDADPVTVEPGEERPVRTIDTDQLDAGWYQVVERFQLGGRGGMAEVQATVEVTG